MADDTPTVKQARQAILDDWYKGDFTQEQLRERHDALIAAVRAEEHAKLLAYITQTLRDNDTEE